MQPLKVVEGINERNPKVQLWVRDTFFFRIFITVKKITRGSQESEEITRDVFTSFLEHPGPFKSVPHIYKFLYTTARNKSLNHNEKLDIKKRHADGLKSYYQKLEAENRKNAEANDQFNYLVCKAIEILPRQQKQVFLLYYVNRLKNIQIAKRLGMSKRTVETQKTNAHRNLKIEVRKDGMHYIFILSFSL
jgi:RNA polymerase sigma-70 factor (ECF subfamily)